MVKLNKIDSNATSLRYAEEASLKVLPGSPIWRPLEPNSYNDFGGNVTTVARNPINRSRQRKKGVITDLDATGGFVSDLTQTNMQDLLQGFFFADLRPKGEELVTAVDIDAGNPDEYEVASTDGFFIGSIIQGQNFAEEANNGVNVVTALVGNVSVEVLDGQLATELTPPADAQIVVVGHEFASAEVDVDVSGTLPILSNVSAVAATGTLTYTANVADSDTVTIGSQTYTYQTVLTDSADNVLIGATADDSVNNLLAAINAGAGAGTLYGTGTVANVDVTAVNGGGDTMDVTAIASGTAGNSIATTETGTNISWAGANLTGGSGTSFLSLGLIPGEWIFLGGDGASEDFVDVANNGFKRVRSITDLALEIDKSDLTMVTETGTGLTIRVFTGRALKNELDALIKRRTYNLERTLGIPDDAFPTQEQAEYVEGAVPSEFSFNVPTADKLTVDLAFVGVDSSSIDGPTDLKTGTRPALEEADAFNTSSDFSRIKLAQVITGDEAPLALFAFSQELTVTINNNLTPNKAVSVLGAFEVTAGTFEVGGSITAYFSDVTAVAAVRDNVDITLDMIMVKRNAGIAIDLPLITLGDGRPNVEQDAPITLPLNMDAATAALIDPSLDYTAMIIFWDFLPNAADI